ncbi:class I SAM-dependent methyltransferase [Micrococcus lylae]|uniref:class I SAM-dependent methyltransferase n=1 Tax=Micrococcus TaxID=1269 RepID=UPI000B4E5135|nr:class I SAM-dependent methyltransferase [Micrococcus sp. FDAARGOS_333]PNL18791.1 class I SAM-dependent methyltransferase [Micrococcus sp. FDAARGOS_333]
MPDAVFDHPRLAAVYDVLGSLDRPDLDEYTDIVRDEFPASRVLDIGCGTGAFALRLAKHGIDVVGVDPAAASIDVARAKSGAEAVTWVVGVAEDAPPSQVDAVTMTANVAQVFLDDSAWDATLQAAHIRLRPGGVLVFEARRPEDRAWERWTKAATHRLVTVPGAGEVETWTQTTRIDGELVTFDSPTVFRADGQRLESTSTLRFRTRRAIEAALVAAGFDLVDVRDLAYAPGRAWLYIARRPDDSPRP